jgi:pyruvate ferredoxin oxidoreductase gamma subunit
MAYMTEVRWHGRGGQGAKTAATLLAEAALSEDKHSQGFPEYGPEREGAPMRGFTRISDAPIRLHCTIDNPDVVVVLDDTLLETVDVCAGLTPDGAVVINTAQNSKELRKRLSIPEAKLFTVNATQIALDEIGRPIPNTPMLGALIKATGVLDINTIYNDVKHKLGKKFTQQIIDGNIKAVKRAYEEVTEG